LQARMGISSKIPKSARFRTDLFLFMRNLLHGGRPHYSVSLS
jgi:hypothetical protein